LGTTGGLTGTRAGRFASIVYPKIILTGALKQIEINFILRALPDAFTPIDRAQNLRCSNRSQLPESRKMIRLVSVFLCLQLLSLSAEAITLVCRMQFDDTPLDGNFQIDTAASTVNGHPATIDEGMIRWEKDTPDAHSVSRINRYTGSFDMHTTLKRDGQLSKDFHGDCSPATQKKF
jgi:hypothetical protein